MLKTHDIVSLFLTPPAQTKHCYIAYVQLAFVLCLSLQPGVHPCTAVPADSASVHEPLPLIEHDFGSNTTAISEL